MDLIGRNDTFEITVINESYPEYIKKNINILNDWIAT